MVPCVLATVGRFVILDQIVLGSYLLGMVLLGSYFSRREKTTDDYFRGGRRVPWWAAGLSIFGTALSSITYVAVPGSAFSGNWTMLLLSISSLLLVPVVTRVYIPFYRALDVTTPYEYLQRRFNTPARMLASAQWIAFQFGRMAIILYMPSLALQAVTGIDISLCIVLMGVLTTLYTMLGGIEAAVWTDVAQVVVLMGGAIVSVVFVVIRVDGGLGAILHEGMAAGKFHTFQWSWSYALPAVWVMVIGGAVANFSVYSTDQALVQRYVVTPNTAGARRALWTSALGGVPTAILFFFLGTAMWVFYKQHGELLPAGTGGDVARMKGDAVFPLFMVQQLPAGVSGLVIAGLFAAAMSTLCSGVNSIAAAVSTDFVRRLRPATSDRTMLTTARVLTAAVGLVATGVALVMARSSIHSQYEFFMMVLGLFTGGLAGLFVLGIFTRRATAWGSLTGAAASAAVMALLSRRQTINVNLYGTISLLVCVVVGYLASLVLPGKRGSLDGLTIFTRRRAAAPLPGGEIPAPPSAAAAPPRSPAGTRA
jgi:solute:Na+ symporter, SSS family